MRLGGIVTNSKTIQTKRGDLMAFVTVEDLNGSIEVVVFSSVYAVSTDLLEDDSFILTEGRVQKDENSVKLIADSIISMERAEELWTARVHFNLDASRTNRDILSELNDILRRHPGLSRAFINLILPEKAQTIIELPDELRIQPGPALRRDVNGLVGYPAVETVCSGRNNNRF